MRAEILPATTAAHRLTGWPADLILSAAAAFVLLAAFAVEGFTPLADQNGDNDSLLRLVQIRDLLGGQGWFDLTQYRMGLDGGFQMHWSRIVDVPIALLTLAAASLTGDLALGEAFAAVAWPLLLYAAALLAVLRAVRHLAGPAALVPAFVIGAISFYTLGLFTPGALDHHNLQLVLTLCLLACLLANPEDRRAAHGAGASAALMLAVGMETVPYVAVGGLCAAALFLMRGSFEAARAGGFGLAFGAVSLGAFVLTVSPADWLAVKCDAFSVAQAGLAAGAGFGLWATVRIAADATFARRALWLTVLGCSLTRAAVLAVPQCLGDPYASLDPRLRTYWLDHILEAQSVAHFLSQEPARLASYYALPVLGLLLLTSRMRRNGARRQELVLAAFLASALLVSLWQVRGSLFSLALAVLPLAIWVGERRELVAAQASPGRTAKLLLAWLLSLNFVWHIAASSAEDLIRPAAALGDDDEAAGTCYRAKDYRQLAGLPQGTVLAISNLGAPILAYTGHRALAGPYHRNVAGNLTTLDILMGGPAQAKGIVAEAGIDYVVHCPLNNESINLAKWSPEGLEARLRRGSIPGWLEAVAGNEDEPLRIYRVVAP
jgi:hypothetical protein